MKIFQHILMRRFAVVAVVSTLLYGIYVITNRFHLFTPVELPLTFLDHAMPFWTWSVIPYFVLIGGMYLMAFVHDDFLFKRCIIGFIIGMLINYSIFVVWPTTYPRPTLPTGTAFYEDWYRWLTKIDTPANCFPSGHITAPAIGCWALAREKPRWRLFIYAGFIPLSLSILTTKQHYVWDLFGGITTAVIGLVVANWWLNRASPSQEN